MPPKEIGDKMRVCFEQNIKPREPGAPGAGGSIPPAGGGGSGMTGPGGCISPEECQKYCESNQEECKNFKSPAQPMPGGTPGSGPMQSCEGENCQPPPNGQQYQSPPSGGGPIPAPMRPCEGGNCPSSPQPGDEQYRPPRIEYPMEPGQPMQPGTQEGGSPGGVPGTYNPPPSGEMAPPQESAPPPPSESAPPTSSGSLNSLLGAVLNPFIEFLFGN